MEWFYPESIQDALKLVSRGYILHAGGTGILLGRRKTEGFIHLGRIPELHLIESVDDGIRLGAMVTYGEVASFFKKLSKKHVLGTALSMAGTTPLRNRITIGGSLGFLPVWSDLIGPLVALDAKITIRGENEGTFNALDFVKRPSLTKNSIITHVSIRKKNTDGLYFRMTRTAVDFADFTITIAGKDDLSIVVTGTREKVNRLLKLEEEIKSTGLDHIEEKIEKSWNIIFSHGRMGSGEFREHLAKVWLARLLKKMGGNSGDQVKG